MWHCSGCQTPFEKRHELFNHRRSLRCGGEWNRVVYMGEGPEFGSTGLPNTMGWCREGTKITKTPHGRRNPPRPKCRPRPTPTINPLKLFLKSLQRERGNEVRI